MTIVFKTQAELDAYKDHIAGMAATRFEALGLGPVTEAMAIVPLPPEPWDIPAKAAAEGRKLILTGPPGSGKTTLLKRIAWNLALRKLKPRGGYIPAMLNKLKSDEVGPYTEWLKGGDILFLDDLDKLRGTHYEGERFLDLINEYDVNKKPIVVTMNVELRAFGERIRAGGVPADYAEAIVSRLTGNALPWFVNGPDHRKLA